MTYLFTFQENALKLMRNADLERKKKKEKIVIEKTENAQRPMKNVEFVKRKKKKTVIKVKRKGECYIPQQYY